MAQPDDLTIERTTDLDIGIDELWELISTAEGWSSWLVDHADVEITPDALGTAVDEGVVRDVRIESVTDGRINFAWWERDDPAAGSYVQLDVVELPDGRSRLHIAEHFVGSVTASTAVSWDVRMVSLWLLALHSTVLA